MDMLVMALIALLPRVALPSPQAPAWINGVVNKLGTGEQLANACVQLNMEVTPSEQPDRLPREDFHRSVKSDRNGRFIFENVAPGNYRLIATYEGGYVPAEYGQRS